MEESEREIKVAEYNEIQRLRVLYSNAMMSWNKIFFTAFAGIFAITLISYRTLNNVDQVFRFFFYAILILIWLCCYFYWRLLVYGHIDTQITGFYRRLLELEKQLHFEILVSYLFNNLRSEAKKKLIKNIHESNEKITFHEFKKKCETLDLCYDLIINLWDDWPKEKGIPVGSRGHNIQNGIGAGITIAYIIFAIGCMFVKYTE